MLKSLLRPFSRPVAKNVYQQMVADFSARISRHPGRWKLPRLSGQRVGVVVTPWQKTAVPFYLVEWALRLRREGLDVEFLWDVWPNESGVATEEETAIRAVLAAAAKKSGIPVVEVESGGDETAAASLRIDHLAFEAVTRVRKREPDAEDPEVASERRRLASRVARVKEAVARRNYAWLLLPGGVWAASGVYWEVSQALGLGLTTFDSGAGLLCFQHGGPAAHFPDLNAAMERLAAAGERDERVREKVEAWVDDRLVVRRSGEDEFRLQPEQSRKVDRRPDMVVPLNYRLDTAAMCRQRLFPSVNEWLRAVVDWAVRHPEITVAVRQHPCEKIPAYRSQEDYTWIAQSGPNLTFIAAEDPINTYDLLEGSRVVLPHSSRVGIEAAIFGKAVILAATSYYQGMPFAQVPATREAYFDAIERSLASTGGQSAAQRRAAYAAYYVAESFGLYKTNFTPMPSDFAIWSKWSPPELWGTAPNDTLLRAAISRQSAAELLVEQQIRRWTEPVAV